jgi:TolA-binding protein
LGQIVKEIVQMKMRIVCSALIVSMGILQSCSSITVLRTQELNAVRDSLQAEIGRLEKKIDEQRQAQDELLRFIRADQQARFSDIEKQIGAVGSNLSENQYRLSRIDEKTADVQRQLEAKLVSDSVSLNTRNAEIEKLFRIATVDFNAGRYDSAKKGFRDLSSRFPESAQGQESEYWAGESLYAKKEFAEAENAMLLYVKKFPQGTKACVALYKLGLCYDKLDKEKSRELVWKKFLDKCPDSQEAKIVKSRGK